MFISKSFCIIKYCIIKSIYILQLNCIINLIYISKSICIHNLYSLDFSINNHHLFYHFNFAIKRSSSIHFRIIFDLNFFGLERVNVAKVKYNQFKINENHDLILFYNINESELAIFYLKNLKYKETVKFKEKIVDVNINSNIVMVTSKNYIRGLNIYTLKNELFMYVRSANTAYLLKNNKILVVYDNQLILYSVYNQIEHKFYYEKYKIFDNLIVILQSNLLTIFDENFMVINEYNISCDTRFDFTLYKGRIVYMIDNKIIGKNYNINLEKYFDKTPEEFYITKRYIYIINESKIYLYDKKGNNNKPLYLLSNDKCENVQRRKKNKIIERINCYCKDELTHIDFDSYSLCNQMLITKYKDKLTSYRELDERYEDYVNADVSCKYIPSECDFETTSED